MNEELIEYTLRSYPRFPRYWYYPKFRLATWHPVGVLTDAVADRRESVAGVSLDEEMTNMVRFQRGYQASARALSAMDDMLDTLITRTGRVGL